MKIQYVTRSETENVLLKWLNSFMRTLGGDITPVTQARPTILHGLQLH